MKSTKKLWWVPYMLLAPSLIFMAIFFAWPMVQSITLALRTDDSVLVIHPEPGSDASIGQLPQSLQVSVLGNQGVPFEPENPLDEPDVWLRLSGADATGAVIEGWGGERRLRVEDETPDVGVVRRSDLELREAPGSLSPIVGVVPEDGEVSILERAELDIWYEISGAAEGSDPVTGWVEGKYIKILTEDESGVTGLIERGDAGEWTVKWIERMIVDRDFVPALRTTVVLLVLILPLQFILAIAMALLLQQRLRGNLIFLYIFAIPLGVSDLAVGIVFLSIFTQNGYLNSLLHGLGLIDAPPVYLSVDSLHWMYIAIVLAEVWRATSIVMVIIVSGLQNIPMETLEAAELFGAGFWQRLRYVILPLLRPSIQVALILRTILAFQVFAVVVAIAGRGLTVMANETYRWYRELQNPHVAAAYALLILTLSMVTAVFYLRAVRTQEEQAA